MRHSVNCTAESVLSLDAVAIAQDKLAKYRHKFLRDTHSPELGISARSAQSVIHKSGWYIVSFYGIPLRLVSLMKEFTFLRCQLFPHQEYGSRPCVFSSRFLSEMSSAHNR
jgi:hypothetical protein